MPSKVVVSLVANLLFKKIMKTLIKVDDSAFDT